MPCRRRKSAHKLYGATGSSSGDTSIIFLLSSTKHVLGDEEYVSVGFESQLLLGSIEVDQPDQVLVLIGDQDLEIHQAIP